MLFICCYISILYHKLKKMKNFQKPFVYFPPAIRSAYKKNGCSVCAKVPAGLPVQPVTRTVVIMRPFTNMYLHRKWLIQQTLASKSLFFLPVSGSHQTIWRNAAGMVKYISRLKARSPSLLSFPYWLCFRSKPKQTCGCHAAS